MKIVGSKEELCSSIKTLEDGMYSANIVPLKTNQQNKMLWKLIRKIAKFTGQTLDEVYTEVLTRADVSSEFILATSKAEQTLKESFKYVRMLGRYNEELTQYQVFYGSSVMSTAEMCELIIVTQQIACELGVDDGTLHNA